MYTNSKFGCPNYMHPKLIKKCLHCSRIVLHTENITNLRTIDLKIKMLVHIFCIPPIAIQQQKLSSGARKIYSTKWKMFLFHFSNIEGPNNQPLSYEETGMWCFARLSCKICFNGTFHHSPEIF